MCIFKLSSQYISNIILYVLAKTPLQRAFSNYPVKSESQAFALTIFIVTLALPTIVFVLFLNLSSCSLSVSPLIRCKLPESRNLGQTLEQCLQLLNEYLLNEWMKSPPILLGTQVLRRGRTCPGFLISWWQCQSQNSGLVTEASKYFLLKILATSCEELTHWKRL